jgi:hypothetical protein
MRPNKVGPKKKKNRGADTEYDRLVLESSKADWQEKAFALISANMLLAGFLMLPGLFLKLQKSQEVQHIIPGQILSHAIQNKYLLITASFAFAISVGVICWRWWVNRRKYYWLYGELFL